MPPDRRRARKRRAPPRSCGAWRCRRIAARCPATTSPTCCASTSRAAARATSKAASGSRCRRCSPTRASSSASSRRRRRCAPASRIASATSISRRGCRSSCGGRVPDAELVKAATSGSSKTHGGLRSAGAAHAGRSARRSAVDALRARSGCGCRTSRRTVPIRCSIPQWDDTLADAFRRETELFFDSLVREDRNVLDLLTADYTFVNERVAKHYGIANVMGNHFRRVTLPDEARRGILGHGSVLQLTSVADRTSPVLRGKWVMEVLLGTPPPPPPPNVPTARRDQGRQGGAHAVGARAHGRASREPGVHVVPPHDRSAGPRARELRLRRASGGSRTAACRSIRRA